MAGPYAHITLLHELIRSGTLELTFSYSSGLATALVKYFPFCVLGAVSPDYPNLARGAAAAPQWADAMHYTRACDKLVCGLRRAKGATGSSRDKQLVWLLGYCAHVVTDMTIHPVVQAKVGVYAENQRQHRICEMNQDSYIFGRMGLGPIGASDLFAQTVVRCSEAGKAAQLDSEIVTLWEGMLHDVHPELFRASPPDISLWHREFSARAAESGNGSLRLFPLAGVISEKMDLAYPAFESVDRQYIDGQLIPSERPRYLDYDGIFDLAVENVAAVWKQIEQAVCDQDPECLPVFGDWNLDNGLDEHGRLVFWE